MKLSDVKVLYCYEGSDSKQVADTLAPMVKQLIPAASAEVGIELFYRLNPHIAVVDLKVSLMDLEETLRKMKMSNPDAEIIVAIGFIQVHTLVKIMESGVFHFMNRPLTTPKLTEVLDGIVRTLDEKSKNRDMAEMCEMLNDTTDLMVITDGKKVRMANRPFFEFCKVADIKEFEKKFEFIYKLFMSGDGYQSGSGWISSVEQSTSAEQNKVKIKNSAGAETVFYVKISKHEGKNDEYVATFSDITDIEENYFRRTKQMQEQFISTNKLTLKKLLGIEVAIAKRYKRELSVIMIRVQAENDESEKLTDVVLAYLKKRCRESDIATKVKKDEIAAILTETSMEGAKIFADRLKDDITSLYGVVESKFGVLMGLAKFEKDDTQESIMLRAEKNMKIV